MNVDNKPLNYILPLNSALVQNKTQVPYSSGLLYLQTIFHSFFNKRKFIIPSPVENLLMYSLSSAWNLGLVSHHQPMKKPIVYNHSHL